MDIRDFKKADEILSEEINYKMFLHAEERNAIITAMHRYKQLKTPKSLLTRLKNIINGK